MPTVPIIPTVGQDPVRGSQFQAGQVAPVVAQQPQMLQQAGQAMERSGEQWQQLEAMRKRRSDIAAHTEREAAIAEKDTLDLVSYLKRQGEEADQSFDGWVKDLDKRYKSALESAPEGQQREWLRERLATQRQRLFNSAIKHREEQSAVWRVSSADSASKAAVEQAAALWASPEADVYVDEARQRADELASLRGLDDGAKAQFVSEQVSNVRVRAAENMLAENRAGQAAAYLAEHAKEIDRDALERVSKTVKSAAIEQGARTLDSSLPTFRERVAAVMAQENVSEDDKSAAIRHLKQFEEQRADVRAIAARDVREQAEQFLRERPELTVNELPPKLREAVGFLGVEVKRTADNPQFVQMMRTQEGQRRLRSLSNERLDYELRNNLTPRGADEAEKLIRGDQSGYTISQLTKSLAIHAGVIPKQSKYGQAGEDEQKLLEWEKRTIAPMVDALRTQLGRPITATDFQEKILDPLTKDTVLVRMTTFGSDAVADAMSADQSMSVIKAQQDGYLPIDNPDTPGVDESLDVKNANVYVMVNGSPVYLNEITMQQRRDIRAAWALNNPGVPLSAAEEVRQWMLGGGEPKGKVGMDRNRAMLEINMEKMK